MRAKNSLIVGLFIAVILPLLMPSSIDADEFIVAYPTDDSWNHQQNPTLNYGSDEIIHVRNRYGLESDHWEMNCLVRFDLSIVPPGTSINSATLHLYYCDYASTDPSGRYLTCHRITSNWDEDTVTWNLAPTYNIQETSGSTVPLTYDWMVWDVTDDVQSYIDGEDNFGWQVMDHNYWGEYYIPLVRYYSKEYGDYIPFLEIMTTQLVDFEDAELYGGDNAIVSDQYYLSHGVTFSMIERTDDGRTLLSYPTYEQRGDTEPSRGFLYSIGYLWDTEHPDELGDLGNYFLKASNTTGAGDVTIIIDYAHEVNQASGEVWDIDGEPGTGSEKWEVTAYDESGSSITSITSPEYFDYGPDTLDGKSWPWALYGEGIRKIEIDFTGTKTEDIGLAFNNFSPATGQTVSTNIFCQPSSGTVPFSTQMTVTLTNLYPEQVRTIAGHIDITLASGGYFPNWRAGFTNVAAGDSYITSWNQDIPYIGTLIGDNAFSLVAEDVTPTPFNQPPYPPSGDTATNVCTVTGIAP